MNTHAIPSRTQRPASFVWSRRFLSAITAALALGAATSASAVLIDFNSGVSDYTGNFTEFGETAGANFTYSSSAGVDGGGGLAVSGNFDGIVYNTALNGFSAGTISTEVSVFYKARSATNGTSNTSIVLGLVTSPGVQLSGSSGTWLSLHIQAQTNTGGPTNFQASFRGRDGGTGLSGGGNSGTFQVVHNNWYKFSTVFSYDIEAGTFSATALIQDYGANGLSETPTIVLSFTSNVLTNVSLAEADHLFAVVRTGAPNATGANALDNFGVTLTTVPEPASVALIMAMAAMGGSVLLRRRGRTDRQSRA